MSYKLKAFEAFDELVQDVLKYVASDSYPSQEESESPSYYAHLEYLAEGVILSARDLCKAVVDLPDEDKPVGWDDK